MPREKRSSNPTTPAQEDNGTRNVVDARSSEVTIGDKTFNMPFLSGLYNLGFNRVVDAGLTTLTQEFLAPSIEHARGISRDYARPKFDPERHLHDQIEFSEYTRALKNRDDANVGEDHAQARLRERKADLDATKKAGERPKTPVLLLSVAIAMIAVSLTTTVHDRYIPVGMDPVLGFLACILLGIALSCAPVLAIFKGRNSGRRWLGFGIGIFLAVSLFGVRAAGVENPSEFLYAGGWAGLELVGVLLAEYFSHAHRKAEVEWESLHHLEAAAQAAVNSAMEDVELWKTRIAAAQSELTRISNHVDDRNTRALRADDIEEMCVKAITDGANAGLAHNLGVVRGLRRAARVKDVVADRRETL